MAATAVLFCCTSTAVEMQSLSYSCTVTAASAAAALCEAPQNHHSRGLQRWTNRAGPPQVENSLARSQAEPQMRQTLNCQVATVNGEAAGQAGNSRQEHERLRSALYSRCMSACTATLTHYIGQVVCTGTYVQSTGACTSPGLLKPTKWAVCRHMSRQHCL